MADHALLKNGTIDEGEGRDPLRVEETINRIIGSDCKAKLKFFGLFFFLVLIMLTSPMLGIIPVFAGYIPYNEWVCISERCFGLLSQYNSTGDGFYNRASMCDHKLVPHQDFNWTNEKSYYSLDWSLICDDEAKGANLKSFFFVGAFVGLILGSVLFDKIGRKITTLTAALLCCVSTAAAYFAEDYYTLLALRILQGVGAFVVNTGTYLLAIEFTPTGLRNLAQLGHSFTWTIGSITCVAINYFTQSWQDAFLIQGILILLLSVPFFFYPESPRFHLVKGREKEAKQTFTRISKIFKQPLEMSQVDLVYQDYQQTSLEQIRDFVKYPAMGRNTIILVFYYMILSAVSYGMLFSWGKLGADIYTAILYSTLVGGLNLVSGYAYFVREYFGRKRALIINSSLLCICFLLAIPKFHIAGSWNTQLVMCLVARPFSAACWSTSTLLAGELSPTSHRGMVLSTMSAAARIGGFLGPYAALLYNIMDTKWVLCLFGAACAINTMILFFIDDSTGKPIPATPADVQKSNEHTRL